MQCIPLLKTLGSRCQYMQRLLLGLHEHVDHPRCKEIAPSSLNNSGIHCLPVEILLHVFSFLELKPYIISHGVCTYWRTLLPLTDMQPSRRRLFILYQRVISTPRLSNSRPWILQNLQPFDRQVYIDSLLAQYPAIPEEFRMWILEWPARLTIACIWPGLPFVDCYKGNAERRYGVNWLGYRSESPQLSAVICKHKTPDVRFIPSLLIWRAFTTTEWLIFDHEDKALFGRVYVKDYIKLESSVVIPHPPDGRIEEPSHIADDLEGDLQEKEVYPDWISYLEHHWVASVWCLPLAGKSHPYHDKPIYLPVKTLFDHCTADALPTCPWTSRFEHPEYLGLQ